MGTRRSTHPRHARLATVPLLLPATPIRRRRTLPPPPPRHRGPPRPTRNTRHRRHHPRPTRMVALVGNRSRRMTLSLHSGQAVVNWLIVHAGSTSSIRTWVLVGGPSCRWAALDSDGQRG